MESLRLGKWSQCWAIPHFCTYLIPQYIRERFSCWRSEVCLYTQPFIQSSIDQSMNQSINHESIYHKSQTPNLVTPRFRQLRHPQDAAFDPMVSCYEDKICMRWIQYKYIYTYVYMYLFDPVRVRVRVYVCIRTYHIQPELEHQPARMVHTWVLRGCRGPWNHIVWIGSFTTDQLPGKGTFIRDLASAQVLTGMSVLDPKLRLMN